MSGISLILSSLILLGCFVGKVLAAEDVLQTPSQKTKEAIDRLGQTPSAISKGLETLKGAVESKLKAGASKSSPAVKAEADDLTMPPKKPEQPEAARFSSQGKRDPFRPATMRARTVARQRENLSPLERFDLGQLKVVGVVWDLKEPRAMIEDSAGLGYIVKLGTPIGANDGTVKAIARNEIVVEEFYEDSYGARKKRDRSMRLATE